MLSNNKFNFYSKPSNFNYNIKNGICYLRMPPKLSLKGLHWLFSGLIRGGRTFKDILAQLISSSFNMISKDNESHVSILVYKVNTSGMLGAMNHITVKFPEKTGRGSTSFKDFQWFFCFGFKMIKNS